MIEFDRCITYGMSKMLIGQVVVTVAAVADRKASDITIESDRRAQTLG